MAQTYWRETVPSGISDFRERRAGDTVEPTGARACHLGCWSVAAVTLQAATDFEVEFFTGRVVATRLLSIDVGAANSLPVSAEATPHHHVIQANGVHGRIAPALLSETRSQSLFVGNCSNEVHCIPVATGHPLDCPHVAIEDDVVRDVDTPRQTRLNSNEVHRILVVAGN